MLMPVVQLRGTPCLHPCLLPFAGLSSGGLVAANPRQPLRAPWASARARSGNCSAILGSNWNAWSRPTSLDRASPPTVIRSTRRPWRYVSSIRAGAQATSASVWPAPLMLRCCPASVPCSVGSVSNTSRRLLPDGAPRPRRRGPLPPTTPGRWMPWNSYAWAAVKASAGCVWSTNTVVPSLAPRFSPLPVGPCPADRGAAAAADGVHPLGIALPAACGQRQAVGFVERSAFGLGGLWLIGLGIDMIWNDPCCPQQNGVVERSQGTAKRWAEPHTCGSAAELQTRLDEDDVLQRERYPLAQGRSRWALFPGLAYSGRQHTGKGTKPAYGVCSVCATTWRSMPWLGRWIVRGRYRSTIVTSTWGWSMAASWCVCSSTPNRSCGL